MLILLSTDTNKLLMQWKGPYEVISKVARHDYKVKVKEKDKTIHANLLKSMLNAQLMTQELLMLV